MNIVWIAGHFRHRNSPVRPAGVHRSARAGTAAAAPSQWAERNGVHQVVCRPDWNRHGRAAPFRRNDELLSLLPRGLIAFPGSGITDNLVEKAMKLGIPAVRAA